MKKLIAMLLACVMVLSVLAGCNKSGEEEKKSNEEATSEEATSEEATSEEASGEDETTEAETESGAILPDEIVPGGVVKADPSLYEGLDKEETVYIALIGGTPNDFDQVLEAANEYLKPYNTKLDFTIWDWGEYVDLYSLNLTSGENIDLIFTAPWCYLWTESSKGSFLGVDEDFITKNMPLTQKYQFPDSWNGVKLNGNIIAFPQNTTFPNAYICAIRQDLAEKYGITELNSWEDYKNYCLTIAEKETPESGILAEASSAGNARLEELYKQQYDIMKIHLQGSIWYGYPYEGEIPTVDKLEFAYSSEWFKNLCADLKEMADAGCWSRSALTNTVDEAETFAALQGAAFAWNTSVFNYMQQAEKTEGIKCAAYDITNNKFALAEAYNNNDMAIAASTKHPERAAMVLDLLKNDTYLNHLFRLGIEGVHYSMDDEGHYTPLDKADDFPKDSLSMAWAIKNGDISEIYVDPREEEMVNSLFAKIAPAPTEGFVFDNSNVSNETSAVDTILGEYIPSLQLGLFDDPDAKIAEMLEACNAAGLDKIDEEFRTQYEAWYESMTK